MTEGRHHQQVSPRQGFSLVELLVVIMAVGILTSLLLPAMSHAKARGMGIRCLANNRQLALAWQMYTDDNRGILLFASQGVDPRTRDMTWVTGVMDFLPQNRSNWDVEEDIKKSPLWPYCQSAAIWRCPGDTSGLRISGRYYPRVRSLAMNGWVGGFAGFVPRINGVDFKVYRNLADVIDPGPSGTWLLMDQREDSINMGNFIIPMHGWPDRPEERRFIVDYPASYHSRAGGLSFIDGHAEIHRWVDERTMPPLSRNANPLAWSGVVPSPHNRDILWLQERSTRKE